MLREEKEKSRDLTAEEADYQPSRGKFPGARYCRAESHATDRLILPLFGKPRPVRVFRGSTKLLSGAPGSARYGEKT
jgi:hypothetical protein